MTASGQHPQLPLEQARNREYLDRFRKWLEKPINWGTTRNEQFVNPANNGHGKSYGHIAPLIGRVGLTEPDEDIGTNFYIGPRYIRGDVPTYSWNAPVARAFFQPDDTSHEISSRIAVIRTFAHDAQLEISAVEEEQRRPTSSSPFIEATLKVQAPPTRRSRRRAVTAPPSTIPPAPPRSAAPRSPLQKGAGTGDPAVQVATMRAPDLVKAQLAAPRSKKMVSVLATLQPDQHDLVTRPADGGLIVQGHPGTGKTVVAAYRAGFLTTPDAPERGEHGGGLKNVLLLGPTAGYVQHVQDVLGPFRHSGATIEVLDLAGLMRRIVDGERNGTREGEMKAAYDDHGIRVMALAAVAVDVAATDVLHSAARPIRPSLVEHVRAAYELLRRNGTRDVPLTDEADLAGRLRTLPALEEAVTQRALLPLLALLHVNISAPTKRYDHIIVDEAQDLFPPDWELLQMHLAESGRWTLIGDQNQRRSATSYTAWESIGAALGLGVRERRPAVMERGYRSTNQILRFADAVLPDGMRQASSIQVDGPEVVAVRAANTKRVASRALDVASDLARRYATGTTAIIVPRGPEELAEFMVTEGWRRPDSKIKRTFTRDGVQVQIYTPERARGLEFDAVVVVEPGKFKADEHGRHGQLYTSLTRANRELVVVHSSPLPKALRNALRGRAT